VEVLLLSIVECDVASDVRQMEIHRVYPILPDPSPFEVETIIAKLKRYRSPVSYQIPAELIQAGGEILRSEIHIFINSIWNKETFRYQWKESIIMTV
jgi:hypothetical protein